MILRLDVRSITHIREGMIQQGVKGSSKYKREAILIGSFIAMWAVVSVGFSDNFPLGLGVVRVAGVIWQATSPINHPHFTSSHCLLLFYQPLLHSYLPIIFITSMTSLDDSDEYN